MTEARQPAHQAGSQASGPDAGEINLLDVKGLNCPMPLLKAKKALNELAPGALLRVMATDPGSERDFQTFSAQSGHSLLEFEKIESADSTPIFVYLLQKKSV